MVQRAVHSSVIIILAASLIAAPVEQAEARHGRGLFAGIAVGLVALAIISASRHHRHHHGYVERRYDPEPRQQCEWRGRTCFDNKYGDHVCQGGEYSCHP
jgi:hypothetical protein